MTVIPSLPPPPQPAAARASPPAASSPARRWSARAEAAPAVTLVSVAIGLTALRDRLARSGGAPFPSRLSHRPPADSHARLVAAMTAAVVATVTAPLPVDGRPSRTLAGLRSMVRRGLRFRLRCLLLGHEDTFAREPRRLKLRCARPAVVKPSAGPSAPAHPVLTTRPVQTSAGRRRTTRAVRLGPWTLRRWQGRRPRPATASGSGWSPRPRGRPSPARRSAPRPRPDAGSRDAGRRSPPSTNPSGG